jgi:hypothetical protein
MGFLPILDIDLSCTAVNLVTVGFRTGSFTGRVCSKRPQPERHLLPRTWLRTL